MAEIIDINHRRRRKPKAPETPKVTAELLRAQIQFLADECVSRTELLEGLPGVFARLAAIAPRKRRADLSRSLCFVSHELDLTAANLRTVLICCLCLFDQYTQENAA